MKWRILSSEILVQLKQFSFKKEVCELPNKKKMPGYYILDFKNPWVHVIALTSENKVILIEQYRHGARNSFLELPGGSAEIQKENCYQSALRELEEETGYSTNDMKEIGSYYPNPALQPNKVHVFLAKNCKLVGKQKLDSFEDISIKLVDIESLFCLFDKMDSHGLMLSSLYLAKAHL